MMRAEDGKLHSQLEWPNGKGLYKTFDTDISYGTS